MMATRREFARSSLLGLAGIKWVSAAGKPRSVFNGVHIGVIAPYSFRALSPNAEQVLQYLVQLGISTVELQNSVVEAFAGAPIRLGPPPVPVGGQRPAAGGPPGGAAPPVPRPLSPEEREKRRKAEEELWRWRLAASMDKFVQLRKLYNDAGVTIHAFKFELRPDLTEAQFAYVFNVAKALGATHVTMELNLDPAATERIGKEAENHKVYVAYHNHTQVKPDSWDTALRQSRYNGINLDVGHYLVATGESPIPFIEKYWDRIHSIHLKDRKSRDRGGDNVPWGEGDTPLKEILQMMARRRYPFPANIELEYPIPEGSDPLKEVARCLEFARRALS